MAEKKRKTEKGMRIVYLRLPLALWERANKKAKEAETPVAYILRQACKRGLDAMGA